MSNVCVQGLQWTGNPSRVYSIQALLPVFPGYLAQIHCDCDQHKADTQAVWVNEQINVPAKNFLVGDVYPGLLWVQHTIQYNPG